MPPILYLYERVALWMPAGVGRSSANNSGPICLQSTCTCHVTATRQTLVALSYRVALLNVKNCHGWSMKTRPQHWEDGRW